MKVSGFTLVRNGVEFDYPFLESIRSLLPLVDELIVNVGQGTDATLEQVNALASAPQSQGKLVVFESDWQLSDPVKKKGGQILAEQTNLALERCTGDWCVYLQADEVLHESDLPILRARMAETLTDSDVEGLVFDYRHFYGSYDVIQDSRSVYRREVRAVKRQSGARSVGDAQSFRRRDGRKLSVVRANARIFHYGWVRTPEQMRQKTFFMDQLYHGDPTAEQRAALRPHTGDNYRYKRFWGLRPYAGEHPLAMRDRIQTKSWHWDLGSSPMTVTMSDVKKVVLDGFERLTGVRLFEYRSYRLIK